MWSPTYEGRACETQEAVGMQLQDCLRKAQLVEIPFPQVRRDAVSSRAESLVPWSLKASRSPAHREGLMTTPCFRAGVRGGDEDWVRLQIAEAGSVRVNFSWPFPNLSVFEHKTSGFHTPHVFIHFYRYIHVAITPVFSVSIPGEWWARHRQDIFCQQFRAALCHHAPTLYHEGTAPLSLAVLFSSAVIFFPDQRNWSPLVLSFKACNNPCKNPCRLSHPSFTGMLQMSCY